VAFATATTTSLDCWTVKQVFNAKIAFSNEDKKDKKDKKRKREDMVSHCFCFKLLQLLPPTPLRWPCGRVYLPLFS
tara:strand:+ start:1023 stop:1250 length:228 start_codon:yes stop_codon:yes gene_type:complete